MGAHRGHIGWIGACALALVPIALPGVAVAETPPPVSVEYNGTVDETETLAGSGTRTYHEQWELVWEIQPPLVEPAWQIKTLTGNVTAVEPPPNQATSCTGSLSDNPRLPVLSYQYTPAFEPGKENVVQVNGNAPDSLLSSSAHTPFGFCGNEHDEATWQSPAPQPSPDPAHAQIDYVLGSGPVSQPFKEEWTEPPGGSNRHLVLDSTLAVNGSAPTIAATPKAVRDAAIAALREVATQALYPCLTAAAGVILFGGVNPIGVVAGGTMAAIGSPVCADAIKLLLNLARTYKDPAVAGYRSVAHVVRRPLARIALPPCGGAPLARCRQLDALARAWAGSFQRARESSQALATTIGREGAARAAHNGAAATLQGQTALRLLPTLRGDLGRQSAAGAALGAFLRRNHVSGSLIPTQASSAIDDLAQRLARLGMPRAQLEEEAGSRLEPRVFDLVGVLAGSD